MPKPDKIPDTLRPYRFHGVDLSWGEGDDQASADCPACGNEAGKWSVKIATSEHHCFVCNFKGNSTTFLKWLWEESDKRTNGETKVLAEDRRIVYPETLTYWGACVSVLSGEWLVPGYGPDGRLANLYKYVSPGIGKKRILMGTPTIDHHLSGVNLYEKDKPVVYLCEGAWNGMALWESMRSAKVSDGRLAFTGNPEASLLSEASVLTYPGCGSVGKPLRKFLPLFDGKKVVVVGDSDHPREANGSLVEGAGYAAVKRAVQILTETHARPSELRYLAWGKDGYDPDRPHGYDVRDALSNGSNGSMVDRVPYLSALLDKVSVVPTEWVPGRSTAAVRTGDTAVSTLPCRDWRTVETAWRKAMKWRQGLGDVLAPMLAVSTSMPQEGDQLFLQVIGDAGSGKTRFCEGMLTSKNCFAVEHLTGFHSGWKDDTGQDFSLLARANFHTLITPEGDTMMSSPYFSQIMSQQRRIFDGSSSASYKNRKEDLKYEGLRTPWIIAGTPALMDTDQSRLGDRFLRVVFDQPTDADRKEILRHVGFSALRSVRRTAEKGVANSGTDAAMQEAYRLTGGYVDHLRETARSSLESLDLDEEGLVEWCMTLGELVSILRARPNSDSKKAEENDTKELPTRLTHQFVRMSSCLAVVLNRRDADGEVLRVVRKIAHGTAHGATQLLLSRLRQEGQSGMTAANLAGFTASDGSRTRGYLRFLERLKAVDRFEVLPTPRHTRGEVRYRLAKRTDELWGKVYGGT